MNHLSDRELLSQILKQDAAALEEFHDRYYDRVYRYVIMRVDGAETAADLTQEVFLRALRAIAGVDIEPHGSLFPWLKTIAHNAVIDTYRAAPRERRVTTEADVAEEGAGYLDSVPSPTPSPQRLMEQAEVRRVVRKALRSLPESQQQVMVFRFIGDMSLREIAAATGQTIPAIKSLIHRGLVHLRKQLGFLVAAPSEVQRHGTEQQRFSTERDSVRIRR